MTESMVVKTVLHSIEDVHISHESRLSFAEIPLHNSEVRARTSLQGFSMVSTSLCVPTEVSLDVLAV
jgi:hypothetical protein